MSVFYGGYFTVIYVCLSNGEVSSVWHLYILFSTEACLIVTETEMETVHSL